MIARLGEHLALLGWMYIQPLPAASSRILPRHALTKRSNRGLPIAIGPYCSGRIDWHPDMLDGVPDEPKTHYHWEQTTGPAVQLIHYLAPENGLILDPLTGTGTYGLAALQTGRRFIGIEADADRHDLATERLNQGAIIEDRLPLWRPSTGEPVADHPPRLRGAAKSFTALGNAEHVFATFKAAVPPTRFRPRPLRNVGGIY